MAETKMQLAEWLDDLCVRFIINLPEEELQSVERICFQVEEAQWFYEDFVRPLDPTLPSLNLKQFCLLIFKVCPFLAEFPEASHQAAYSQFLAYKTRVPVRGAIMLNEAMDSVLLVKGWKKGANWSFPRGKINKDESDLDCAVREVYEETGYDIAAAGLVPDVTNVKYIEVTMREQHMKLFVFKGVPMDTPFAPRTRKEISKISWFKLASLPGYQKKRQKQPDTEDVLSANKLYMVVPFLVQLRKWIAHQKKLHGRHPSTADAYNTEGQITDGDYLAEEEMVSDFQPNYTVTMPSMQFTAAQPDFIGGALADPASDAAGQMKRLLGVGQPQQFTQQPQQPVLTSNANNLLDMLRRGNQPMPSSVLYNNIRPPQTPLDRISFDPPEPTRPRHPPHQPQPFSSMPPPPTFPISPAQNFSQQPHMSIQHQLAPSNAGSSGFDAFGRPTYPLESPTPRHEPPQYRMPQPIGHPAQRQNIPAPYHRTGDPSFAVAPQMPQQQGPIIPSASQLPAPKLNNHAMNLLAAFKSGTNAPNPVGPSAQPNEATGTLPPKGTSLADVLRDSMPSNPQTQPRSNSRQTFGGLVPSVLSPTGVGTSKSPSTATNGKTASGHQASLLGLIGQGTENKAANAKHDLPPHVPAEPKGVNVHQDALLGLFKSPKQKQVNPVESPAPVKGLSAAPVELSANPSPGLTSNRNRKPDPIGQPNGRPTPAMIVPKILQRPQRATEASAEEPKTSATVSSPPNIPDLKSVRHNQRSVNKTPERIPGKGSRPASQEVTPIQILKRPVDPAKQEVTASKPTAIESAGKDSPKPKRASPARTTKSVDKASAATHGGNSIPAGFQPQILRRPQADPQRSPASPQQSALLEQPEPKDSARQTLLSLFNSGAKHPASPQLVSPTSPPASAAASALARSNSELPRTSISSIVSPSSDLARSRLNSSPSTTRTETPLEDRKDSGAQTPISPADRGFLLNYLEGVVKNVPR